MGECSSYRKGLVELADGYCPRGAGLAVMESTSVCSKPVFEVLEEMIPRVYLVNSRHVKNVPGRKTDVKDSEWLAVTVKKRISFSRPWERRGIPGKGLPLASC